MNPYFIGCDNTNDLVEGIALTITSSGNFDYADCYENLKPITDIFYQSIKNPVTTRIYTKPPNDIEVEISLTEKRLIIVYVIAPHKNGDNYHIHGFIYGLHNYSIPINDFTSYVDREIKKLKYLSSKNRYSVLLKPITDQLDFQIREHNSYEPLLNYITKPQFDTFTHYLKHKNSNQFIYHYL
jgi:hypothetical protein